MRVKEIMRRSCAVTAMAALVAYHVGPVGSVKAAEMSTGSSVAVTESEEEQLVETSQPQEKQQKGKKDYLVKFKTKTAMKQSQKTYVESDEINENSEEKLEENKLVSLELTGKEVNQLETNQNVEYVEEDKEVSACGEKNWPKKGKKKHKKVEKRHKKNESDIEWNVQMIHAENMAKKQEDKGKKKVKIAILDSGIDWGNDIELAYQTSLVPGEEEMTQMFMDGSGHGSSVASLIAARDDGEGITGINPNVDIYSYRVLDDGNKAPISRVVEAIYMAINHKVNIINMSFGISEYSEALEKAVQDAADAGILVVAAAGNTGSKGVQYPAAYEDVMAVGAVDKYGSVEQYSARGEELDLVAPGELVRTTGFIGTEEVVSGTSLAAPQVAAAASLIMEKNMNCSPEFVRALLNETANLYGESAAYGSGLLDAEYALEQYDCFDKKYTEDDPQNAIEVKTNQRKVETFGDTGCVEGSWEESKHLTMVDSDYFSVRQGVRFPDIEKYGDYDHRVFARMSLNPWWHGYKKTNYIKAVLYATYMADAIGEYGKGSQGKASIYPRYKDAAKMKDDIDYMDSKNIWATELAEMKKNNTTDKAKKQKDTAGFRRAFVWGMAIHSATDIFAHSVRYKGALIDHTNNIADNPGYCDARCKDAQIVAKQMMKIYKKKEKLRVGDLLLSSPPTEYKLYDIYSYVKEASDSNVAAPVAQYSYSESSK